MSKSAYENCPNSGEGKLKIDAAIRERSQIEKILTHHGLDSQAPLQRATQCTLAMTEYLDSVGVARYPVGICPVTDPATGATLVDERGRCSYTTSIAFGPSIGKNIALAYLPHDYCQVGRELQVQYFADVYPVRVEAVGYRPLYDPENGKPRS